MESKTKVSTYLFEQKVSTVSSPTSAVDCDIGSELW